MKYKKTKFSIIITGFLALMFVLSGCSNCMRAEWQKVYDAYMIDPDGYQTIKATILNELTDIQNYLNSHAEIVLKLEVDTEDYEAHYKTDDRFLLEDREKWRADLEHYNNEGFICIETNLNILKENRFFDEVKDNTIVSFTTHRYLGWIGGWDFPILGVQIGDKTYLDFETGKDNWLNYMEEQMK